MAGMREEVKLLLGKLDYARTQPWAQDYAERQARSGRYDETDEITFSSRERKNK